MHSILYKLLAKRGIKSVDELDKEEKKDFEDWNKVLSKDELTLQDFKNFCQAQIDIIEAKWSDYNLEQSKKSELIPYHSVYQTLLKVVDSPKKQREMLEKNLLQMLEK